MVLAAALIKDGIEEYYRYRQDKAANYQKATVLRNSTLMTIHAKDIVPADIIYYQKGDKFQVDSVIISTSYDDGSCFVDTAELDGCALP